MKKLFVLSTIFCLTTAAGAQSVVAAQGGGGVAAGNLSNSRVTLTLRDVRVSDALRAVAKQADIRITFGDRVLEVANRVNVNAQNSPVDGVIRNILKGTGITMSVTQSGQLFFGIADKKSGITQGVITGTVKDAKTGKGISGASVSVGNDSRGVTTDEDGAYRLAGIAAGVQTVTVRLVGYAKQTRSVTVGEGGIATVDFRLEPSANVLNDVVVTGTVVSTELKAVPNAITVITAKQIEERGITRIDQLFRGEVPGMFALERGAMTGTELGEVVMYSRGPIKISTLSTPAADVTVPIKTYVDGVELADSKYLNQIDPKSVERIEILTGPQASTIYGSNAINGIMQIFTKRGSTTKPALVLNLLAGFAENNFSSALTPSYLSDASISGTEGKVSYNIGGGWNYLGSWTPSRKTQVRSLYGSGRYQSGPLSVDLSTRRGRTQNKSGGASTQVITNLAESGVYIYSAGALGSAGISAPSIQALIGRTTGLTLGYIPLSWWSHQLTIGNDVSNTESFRLSGTFTVPNDSNSSANQTTNYRTSQTYSSTLIIGLMPQLRATLTYGVDHWGSRSTRVEWRNVKAGQIADPSVTQGPDKNSGAYVQGQFGILDALFFTYGVRSDWNPSFGDKARVRPGRYGVSYAREIGPVSAKLRGSYGRSIRPPNNGLTAGLLEVTPGFSDVFGNGLYVTLPNLDLGPEFQQGGEGGIELYLGNRGSFVVTRYNQTVEGLISDVFPADSAQALQPGVNAICDNVVLLQSDGYCYRRQSQYLNVGSIRNQGWELQGSVNAGPFTTRGTYSWTKSRVIGVTPRYRAIVTNTAFTPGGVFEYAPEHTWNVNMLYARRGTSVSMNVNGVGSVLKSNGELALVSSTSFRMRAVDSQRWTLPSSNYRQAISGYAIASLNIAQRFSGGIDGTLQITNLTDFYRNDFNANSPTTGRQSKAGLRLRF